MTMNSQQRYRRYLEKQAQSAPDEPRRPQFLIDATAPEDKKLQWRLLRGKVGPEEAARQIGIKGHWEMV